MTFQTFEKDENNREKKLPEGLKKALRSIWLGRQSVNGTFSTKEYDPNFNIGEVLEVLQDEEVEEDKSC